MQFFKRGDWVNAETPDGDIYTGWILHRSNKEIAIQSMLPYRRRPVFFKPEQVVVLPDYVSYEFLFSLIDLALDTWDKAWFNAIMNDISLYEDMERREAEIHANWQYRE